MSQVDVSPLFQPFECKSLKLKNRIAMAPMTRQFSPNYIPGDDVVEYYRRRAANEVGLIITEGTTVNHPAAHGYENVPAFHGEALHGGLSQEQRDRADPDRDPLDLSRLPQTLGEEHAGHQQRRSGQRAEAGLPVQRCW